MVQKRELKRNETIALVVFTLSTIIPALILTGFMPIKGFTQGIAIPIAAIGGAIAGYIFEPHWRAGLAGTIVGLGVLLASIFYCNLRTSIFNIELLIPIVIGCLPGVIVYMLLKKMTGGGDSAAE